jgi:hypothetical protein
VSDKQLLQGAHALILRYSQTSDAALAEDRNVCEAWLMAYAASLVPCEAVIWHGPGHQSKTTCALRGPHRDHYAHIKGEEIEWSWPVASLDYNGIDVYERVYCTEGDNCHVLREPGATGLCGGYMHPRNRHE